jgi:phasin family protein
MDMNVKSKTTEAVTGASNAAVASANRNVDQTVTTLKDGMAQATAGFEKTQAKVKEGLEQVMKTAEELVQFSQGNVEAFVKSGQIWAEGVQSISKQVATSAQTSVEQNLSTLRALTNVRSVKEAIDLQANLARSSVEKAISDSGRLADASVKLAERALAPLTARVTLAVEKFAKPAV